MIYRIVFTKPASRDLGEIDDYMRHAAGPAVSKRLLEEIIATVQSLRTRPTRQRERAELAPGLRGLAAGNYMIFYRVDRDTVRIVRILHGARNITAKLFPSPR